MNLNALNAYSHATTAAAATPSSLPSADTPVKKASQAAQSSGLDSFEHTGSTAEDSGYAGTMYRSDGTPDQAEARILPERYYAQLSGPRIGYKGSMVSYAELLEEAVSTGQMTLDESQSVYSNFERAEQLLIWDKAAPLFPWSSTSYTEDGQYVCRVENGRVTGAHIAYYYDQNGRKVTARDIAEQLASGMLPTEVDGDYEFLWSTDPELYFKSLEIGSARRQAEDAFSQFDQNQLPEKELREEIEPWLILLFGRDGIRLSLAEIRERLEAEDFGSRILDTLGTLPEKTAVAEE